MFNRFDCDVFVHTWSADPSDWEKLMDLYRPVTCRFEPQKDFAPEVKHTRDQFWCGTRPIPSRSMFYSIRESNRLKREWEEKTGRKYDFVVRLRFDIEVRKFFDKLDGLSKDTLYVPAMYLKPPELFCDFFWVAGGNVADKVAGVYDKYDAVVDAAVLKEGRTYNEQILSNYVNSEGVRVEAHEKLRCELVRRSEWVREA